MNYMITNPNRRVFIHLNEYGQAETCGKDRMQRFEHSKAKNILNHLPKTYKKFHFKVEAIPEITEKVRDSVNDCCKKQVTKTKVITSESYKVSDNITEWVHRVKTCNDIANDAKDRKEQLIKEISSIDRELSNCMHEIELGSRLNACAGYKEYIKTKEILHRRRDIKDELLIVSAILDSNLSSIASNRIEKAAKGLENRKFQIRETDIR